jgi:hypothetical protein
MKDPHETVNHALGRTRSSSADGKARLAFTRRAVEGRIERAEEETFQGPLTQARPVGYGLTWPHPVSRRKSQP